MQNLSDILSGQTQATPTGTANFCIKHQQIKKNILENIFSLYNHTQDANNQVRWLLGAYWLCKIKDTGTVRDYLNHGCEFSW